MMQPGGDKLTGHPRNGKYRGLVSCRAVWNTVRTRVTLFLTSPTASPDSAFCGRSRSSPSAEPGLSSHSISPAGSQVPSATVHSVAYGRRAPSPELNFCRGEERGKIVRSIDRSIEQSTQSFHTTQPEAVNSSREQFLSPVRNYVTLTLTLTPSPRMERDT